MIAGLKGTSLIDYPGRVAAVLYTKGCNFRCPFCHNPSLVRGEGTEDISQDEVLETLAARRGFIDGVVVTGGEPTVHAGLGDLLTSVRQLGLAIKLDTNGSRPDVLERLLRENLVDFIAMDVKTSLSKYSQAAGVEVDTGLIAGSIELIKSTGVEHDFRTTCVPSLVDGEDIGAISRLVGKTGHYTLQQFQPVATLDPEYSRVSPYAAETLRGFLEIARPNVASCRLIGME